MIRLLLLFIPYIFFLIFTCYNFGELILSKINIKFNKYLQIAIGFISIIALFQLVFYPVMVLQLGSIFLTIIGIIVLAFLIGLDIKKIKNIKTVFKDKWIFLLLFLTVIVFFIYMRAMPNDYWFYDDSFYLPLMSVNSNTDKLFSIEPRIGAETSKITSIYMYQGYYMVGSFIISIFNLLKNLFILKFNYVTIVMYYMSFPTFLILIFMIFGLQKQLSNKIENKMLLIALYIFYIIFLPIDSNLQNNVMMAGYSGVFSSLSLYYPLLMYFIFSYLKGEKKYVYLLFILFTTLLSYASFNLFNILIILFSMIFIKIYKKENINIRDFIIMAYPVILYMASFFINNNIAIIIVQIVLTILFILYLKFYKNSKVEEKFQKYIKYIIYALLPLPIIFSVLFIILKLSVPVDTVEYIKNILGDLIPLFSAENFHYSQILITFVNLVIIAFIIFNYHFRKKENKNVLLFIFIISLIFLNPLSISFISKTMTKETFMRMVPLIMNPIVIYYIVSVFINKIDKRIVVVGCLLLSLLTVAVELRELEYWVQRTGKTNKLFRMRERDLVASSKLDTFVANNNIDEILLASDHSDLRIINPDVKLLYDRTLVVEPNREFTKIAYYNSFLYNLNKGEIRQEYLERYNGDIEDVFNTVGINFITIEVNCPYKGAGDITPNVLCPSPKDIGQDNLDDMKKEYKEDKKIYNELLTHLKLVYETERYRLYYIEKGE